MSITWVGESVWEERPAPEGRKAFHVLRSAIVNLTDVTWPGHDAPRPIEDERAWVGVDLGVRDGFFFPGAGAASYRLRLLSGDLRRAHALRRLHEAAGPTTEGGTRP